MTERFTQAKTFTLNIQRPREVLVTAANSGTTSKDMHEVNGEVPQPRGFIAKVLVVHASDAKEDALKVRRL